MSNDKENVFTVLKVQGLPSLAKCLLVILAVRQSNNEFSFPSLDTLQIDSGIAKRTTLVQFLKMLSDFRYIHIEKAKKGQKTNNYTINYAEIHANIEKYRELDTALLEQRRLLDRERKREYRAKKKLEKENSSSKNVILGITLKRPVTVGHPSSDRGSPVQSPCVTRPVTVGHPNININKQLIKNNGNGLFIVDANYQKNKAIYEIAKIKQKLLN